MSTVTERYAAIVTSNDDPKKLGRIKVQCSALSGDEDQLPDFINPCFDWGWFYVPDVGEEVEIEVVAHDAQEEGGAYEQAFVEEPDWRWRGKRFTSEQGDQPRPPEAHFTKKNYGKRRGFATPAGHFLMFDDTDGGEMISLTLHRKATGDYSFVSLDKDGSVIISNNVGGLIYMNAKASEMTMVDADGGNTITSKKGDGIKLIDQYSNIVQLKQNAIQILAQTDVIVQGGANVAVSGQQVHVNSGTITVGNGADSPFVRYLEWLAWNDAHVHLTAFGPSGPPVPPAASVPAIASTTAMVKCSVLSVLLALFMAWIALVGVR